MSAQEQPVKKRRFPLRIFQIRWRNRRHELDARRRHGEIAVYRNSFPRQVVLRPTRRVPINSPTPQPASTPPPQPTSGSVGFSLRSYDHPPNLRLNPQSAHPTLRHPPASTPPLPNPPLV